ncbi:MAG: response regulator transcription factor, partial [Clostridia bacterium]|nr:response regulator transcription factor [Clostridia bacterium]
AATKFRKLNEETILIFVTNMKKYAISGYEVGALNYILKPLNYYSFAMTLDRALRSIESKRSELIRIRTEVGFKVIECRDVYYLEVMKHNVIFHTAEGVFNNYGSLNEWEKKLSAYNFVRCSSCALVNLRQIVSVEGDDILIGSDVVRISRMKKRAFLKIMAEFFGEKI